MKKIVALFLALCAAIGLVGCGKTKPVTGEEVPDEEVILGELRTVKDDGRFKISGLAFDGEHHETTMPGGEFRNIDIQFEFYRGETITVYTEGEFTVDELLNVDVYLIPHEKPLLVEKMSNDELNEKALCYNYITKFFNGSDYDCCTNLVYDAADCEAGLYDVVFADYEDVLYAVTIDIQNYPER